jgi:hypothetical protein
MEYSDDSDDNIINKPIIKQIEKILENEKSYYTSNDILRGIFQKFNITHDIIRDIIKSNIIKKEKCKICCYISEYTNNKHIYDVIYAVMLIFVKNVMELLKMIGIINIVERII